MNPPVQLDRYFFSGVHIEADPPRKADDPVPKGPRRYRLDVEFHIEQNPEAEDLWTAQFTIVATPEDDTPPSYNAEISVVGFLRTTEDVPDDVDVEELIGRIGYPILYSATREFLLGVTARGPWPAMQLPIIFLNQWKKPTSDDEGNEQPGEGTDEPR